MMDWLKYMCLELRFLKRNYNAEYQKPSFKDAKPVRLIAGGNAIFLSVPKHRSYNSPAPIYLKYRDGMDMIFRNRNAGAATNYWIELPLLSRRSGYQFSWFRGAKGYLDMYMAIVTREEGQEFSNTSFFHPRSFEFILASYLSNLYGHRHTEGSADYIAPVNWKIYQQLSVFSASFEVKGVLNEKLYYVFPITDTHFIRLVFSYHDGNDKNFKNELRALAKQIIESVTLELGPQSQMQWDTMKATCQDMQLSENFSPLKWPISVEDIDKPAVILADDGFVKKRIQ